MNSENILAKIPGGVIGEALGQLAPEEGAQPGEIRTVVTLPFFGPVRFQCRRMTWKHGRMTHHAWTAIAATRV